MIAVVDYGAGNLRNVCKALEHVGARPELTSDAQIIKQADKVVLPGVGAFADCRQGLISAGLFTLLQDVAHSGTPFLGICVGMQLLFDVGHEMGEWSGLGLIPGHVVRFDFKHLDDGAKQLKVPHIGWNMIEPRKAHRLLTNVQKDGYAYFVHSFHPVADNVDDVVTTTSYGYDFASIVARENVWGIQFHPEKSQEVGLQILRNFVEVA
ncbi:MAG TPA: imidazole glycerol phosphate synthase subunit HisH [Anaerolineae bacterium]|jgi:glutamine amidotransferase